MLYWKKEFNQKKLIFLQSVYRIKPEEVQKKSSVPKYNSSPQESNFDSL